MVSLRKRAVEAVPKVFQTFNSLLGGIVRKKNATIVGPSKQLVGEFPEVDFERLYQYYHHWDQIKTAVDVMHQKFRGSGIEIKSNNEYFNTFIEKWWDITNSEKKWSQFIYSLLITGSAIMELQYTPDGRLGNEEQIPMQTIYRLFRDQFGNELKIVQIVDGVFKELDPQFFIHHTINNPDRQAFGKSMFHTLASPRPIIGKQDPITGESINPEKNLMPLLDMQAILQNDEMEIKHKMAKPRLIVGANGMPKEQMEKVQAEMADPDTDQYIWVFDKPVNSAELQVQANGKFDEYGNNVDAHIDVGTVFASNVIKNPQGFSYSGSQTPFDVLDQRMGDLQGDLAETIKDRLLKPLAESWGFQEFDAMDVKVSFIPTMKRLTMEDIRGLDPETVSPKEKREMYKKLNIPLDDQLWEDYQNEMKQDKHDQKNIQMQSALTGMGNMPPNGKDPSKSGDNPFKTPPKDGDDKSSSAGGSVKSPTVTPPKTDFEQDRPTPERTQTPQPVKKPRGESLQQRLIKEIANEGLSVRDTIEVLKAIERITLPPKAGDMSNSSNDLYVSQGLDDEGSPEITDPSIRDEYGLDKDESELPPSTPSKMAHAGDRPNLQPADNTNGRFTNSDNQKNEIIYSDSDEIRVVSQDEYQQHLDSSQNGDEIQGGLGNDGINPDSDGSFKDPEDRENDMERLPEEGNTDNPMPHAGPNQEPLVSTGIGSPDNDVYITSGGSDAYPNNTKDQIIGSDQEEDEQPIVPSEGFDKDNDMDEIKKKTNRQNLSGEGMEEKPEHKPNDWFKNSQTPKRDKKDGEEPFTSGTDDERYDVDKNLDQPRKPQARLDDSPLFENPNDDSKGTIDPNEIARSNDSQSTMNQMPTDLMNDEPTDDALKFENPLEPEKNNVLGDSNQERLRREEQTGEPQDQMLPNDSNSVFDNTGLNMKPDVRYNNVSEDDYLRKTQSGENPLENEGDPLEDGMVIKPEDIQQNDGINRSPITPDGSTVIDQSQNTMNDPTDSGIDEDAVNPNILHIDPETGRNYTDLTDEQGNEVPDLRFDQTPTSDEEQPEVELEYEIVTKDEYEQHLDQSNVSQDGLQEQPNDPVSDPMSNDPVNDPMLDTTQDNINQPELGLDNGLADTPDKGIIGQSEDDEKNKPPKAKSGKKNTSDKPDESVGNSDTEEPKDKKTKKPSTKKSPKKPKQEDDKPKKKSGKKQSKKDDKKSRPDKEDVEDLPDKPSNVDEIIKREHDLIEKGVPEDEIHDILLDEFGEDAKERRR